MPTLRSVRWVQSLDHVTQHRKRIPSAVGFALLEVGAVLAHRVGDVRKTKKPYACRPPKGVERRGFHLDTQNSLGSRGFDRLGRFAERRVGSPGRADDDPGP